MPRLLASLTAAALGKPLPETETQGMEPGPLPAPVRERPLDPDAQRE